MNLKRPDVDAAIAQIKAIVASKMRVWAKLDAIHPIASRLFEATVDDDFPDALDDIVMVFMETPCFTIPRGPSISGSWKP